MSSSRWAPTTTVLAVTDSIGKLSPQKSGRRFSGGVRGGKNSFGPSNARRYDANKGGFGNRNSKPTEQPRFSKPAPKAKESLNIEDDDSEDVEDRRIAELEKKLGMDKERRSKVEDDGLDGILLPSLC
jgi:hypothetical protein